MGRRTLAILGALLAFAMLAGCSGSGEEGNAPDEVPASPEEAGEVVVRVSGTEGAAYAGTYGSIAEEGEPRTIEDALGDEPTEYEVEIEQDVSDGVSAFFSKRPSPATASSGRRSWPTARS